MERRNHSVERRKSTGSRNQRCLRDNFGCRRRILPSVSCVYAPAGDLDAGPAQGADPMKPTLIRYRTKPEKTEENERLIKGVFAELRAKSPEGVRYAVLKLADGSFFHFVETEADPSPIPQLEAFRAFQSGVRDRAIDPPQSGEVTIVGNYRMLGES
jgi:hypothetical protein